MTVSLRFATHRFVLRFCFCGFAPLFRWVSGDCFMSYKQRHLMMLSLRKPKFAQLICLQGHGKATLKDSFLADLEVLSDNKAKDMVMEDADGENIEEDIDGELAGIESLNYDDLDSVSKLQNHNVIST